MIILHTDGTITHEKYTSFRQLQKLIAPQSMLVEPVKIHGTPFTLWGDEEAKLYGNHKINRDASLIYRDYFGGDYMAGTCAICKDKQTEDGTEIADLDELDQVFILVMILELRQKYAEEEIKATGPSCAIYVF